MKLSAPSRYTLRQIAVTVGAAAGVITPVYAAVFVPIKDDIKALQDERVQLIAVVSRMAGQLDAIADRMGIRPAPPVPFFPFTPIPESP